MLNSTPDCPNGVGNTLVMTSKLPELSWSLSPVDATHDAAEYYIVYASSSPSGGFSMVEGTANTITEPLVSTEPLVFYKIVSANLAGTSGDEPAP